MNKVKHLFNDALELETGEREKFLAEACGSDTELRNEIESLLSSYQRVEDFLQTPAADFSASEMAAQVLESEEASAIGKQVGAYRIEREIGRGGMGIVYLAARADNQFQKKVAIKLLRRGAENEALVRRFHRERQILADLEHPNIARLIDGGTTENELPYLVMEFVEGVPVNRFCSEHNLSIDDRLQLFRQICAAVEFAHKHSIIHRDIKPSNITVTKDGTPKLLDFGIAKTFAHNSSTLASTATALRVMTPEYASPEQMRGGRVTKATDIYSLGILLYELLTGNRPFNFDNKSPYEIILAICEEEPIPPSTAAKRQSQSAPDETETKTLDKPATNGSGTKLIKGDLDNIVLKSLRKEPDRRYSSVEEFSEDVRRFLEGFPVSARNDSFIYRSTKFLKRYQTAVLSSFAAAFVFLLIGFSLTFLSNSKGINELTPAKSGKEANLDLPIERKKGGTDNEKARNIYLVGQSFWNQRTELSLKQALDYFQQAAQEDPEFALAYSSLSNTYFLLSVWGSIEAKEAFPKAKEASLKALNIAPEAAEGHLSLAMIFWLYEYDWQAADREFKTAIELNPDYARAPHWYGLFLAEMGRFDEAVTSEKRALALEPQSMPVNADYARVLFYARRYDESIEQYRKTIEMNPNFGAFYSELLELYETRGMLNEWYALMDKLGSFKDLSLRSAYQTGGINGYYRERSKLLENPEYSNWYYYYTRAEFFAQLGETDRALELLNKAFEVRSHRMAQLKVNPKLDNLRSDPRFNKLLQRMKLSN